MKRKSRLTLRPLELWDFENWRQAYSIQRHPQNEWDEAPWKDSELTKAKFKAHLKKLKIGRDKENYHYGIFRNDDGVLLGEIRIGNISRNAFQNGYLGYRIFNSYWGQGYASEASRRALEVAFRELKLHRVEAWISPENKASLRVAKAIGLRKEGLSLRRVLDNGKWRDMLIYAATSEDFGQRFRGRRLGI